MAERGPPRGCRRMRAASARRGSGAGPDPRAGAHTARAPRCGLGSGRPGRAGSPGLPGNAWPVCLWRRCSGCPCPLTKASKVLGTLALRGVRRRWSSHGPFLQMERRGAGPARRRASGGAEPSVTLRSCLTGQGGRGQGSRTLHLLFVLTQGARGRLSSSLVCKGLYRPLSLPEAHGTLPLAAVCTTPPHLGR